MILLIDAGNTRLKWRLVNGSAIHSEGASLIDVGQPFEGLQDAGKKIKSVAISTVGSEAARHELEQVVHTVTSAPITFHWAEAERNGLSNSYQDVSKMGADRWHAMVAGWETETAGFAVVDAGSAVTVDYVGGDGRHLGGYILPGLQMMRRSLRLDAARIGFDFDDQVDTRPGVSTGECANHGLAWLTQGVIGQITKDVTCRGLGRIILTGGDADRFIRLGLAADYRPGLVLDGLQAIHSTAGTL